MTNKAKKQLNKISKPPELPVYFQDNDIIADPLYGLVRISAFEKRLINTPEFQRLRGIKQLGFANLVYPAAEHSRFVHSIGVCHQAKVITDRINENMRINPNYPDYRTKGEHIRKEKEDKEEELPLILPEERVIIAASALLHDLSHAPFSHEVEGARGWANESRIEEIIPSHDDFDKNPALFRYLFHRNSDMAKVIMFYNSDFYSHLMDYYKHLNKLDLVEKHLFREFWEVFTKDNIINNGYVLIGNGRGDKLLNCENIANIREQLELTLNESFSLPLLGVMIFETLLFKKQDEYLTEEKERTYVYKEDYNDKPLEVIFDYNEKSIIKWKPIKGWFRAYRSDIIANTICADLIDYVNRDGYLSGIISKIDLKFFDRMFITRHVFEKGTTKTKEFKGAPSGTIHKYSDIPNKCEHVVFDIWDKKRGCVRQSVLTEILNFLQARYLLFERVYSHRVVEGAHAMIHEIISLLYKINPCPLKVELMHIISDERTSESLPVSDIQFLDWISNLKSRELYSDEKNRPIIDKAIELATLIQDRRIFREAVIIDGMQALTGKSIKTRELRCRTLSTAFFTKQRKGEETLEQIMCRCNDLLREYLLNMTTDEDPLNLAILGVREWQDKFKLPLVLVGRPTTQKEIPGGSWLEISPLFDLDIPGNVKKQLSALQQCYNELWKIYLFVHPTFCRKEFLFIKKKTDGKPIEEYIKDSIFRRVEDSFLKSLLDLAGIECSNSVIFSELFSGEPLDTPAFIEQRQMSGLDEKKSKRIKDQTNSLFNDILEAGESDKELKQNLLDHKKLIIKDIKEHIMEVMLFDDSKSKEIATEFIKSMRDKSGFNGMKLAARFTSTLSLALKKAFVKEDLFQQGS